MEKVWKLGMEQCYKSKHSIFSLIEKLGLQVVIIFNFHLTGEPQVRHLRYPSVIKDDVFAFFFKCSYSWQWVFLLLVSHVLTYGINCDCV